MSNNPNLGPIQKTIVGAQFLFVAFGATVLVPLLVGLDPSVALLQPESEPSYSMLSLKAKFLSSWAAVSHSSPRSSRLLNYTACQERCSESSVSDLYMEL